MTTPSDETHNDWAGDCAHPGRVRSVMPFPHRSAGAVAAVGLALAAAVWLVGCTSAEHSARPAAAATGASAGSAESLSLSTVDGRTVVVPDGRPAALFFFAVGCGECSGGAKSVARAAQSVQTAGGGASFVLVDMNPSESATDITGFQSSTGTQRLPAVVDTRATLTTKYSVAALSTLIVLAPSGKLTYRAADPSADQITAALHAARAS